MMTINPLSDPDLHRAACRIVNRVAFMVQPTLRNVDERDFVCEAYAIVRDELLRFDKDLREAKRMGSRGAIDLDYSR
jgi:hypothetical protein